MSRPVFTTTSEPILGAYRLTYRYGDSDHVAMIVLQSGVDDHATLCCSTRQSTHATAYNASIILMSSVHPSATSSTLRVATLSRRHMSDADTDRIFPQDGKGGATVNPADLLEYLATQYMNMLTPQSITSDNRSYRDERDTHAPVGSVGEGDTLQAQDTAMPTRMMGAIQSPDYIITREQPEAWQKAIRLTDITPAEPIIVQISGTARPTQAMKMLTRIGDVLEINHQSAVPASVNEVEPDPTAMVRCPDGTFWYMEQELPEPGCGTIMPASSVQVDEDGQRYYECPNCGIKFVTKGIPFEPRRPGDVTEDEYLQAVQPSQKELEDMAWLSDAERELIFGLDEEDSPGLKH